MSKGGVGYPGTNPSPQIPKVDCTGYRREAGGENNQRVNYVSSGAEVRMGKVCLRGRETI